METMPFIQQNLFNRLAQVASYASLSPEERREYDADLKAYRDLVNQSKYEREISRAEGRAEGLVEGRAEEKKRFAREKAEMVLRMAGIGMGIEQIADVVKMPFDKIKEIIKNKF